jgi:hypothetical protein
MSSPRGRSARERRPGFAVEQRRRRAFVRSQLRQHGQEVSRGVWLATCQVCGKTKTLPLSRWWADHITPVALGGSESGPLQLSCAECQIKQGSAVGNAVNPMAQPRKRSPEEHPGMV